MYILLYDQAAANPTAWSYNNNIVPVPYKTHKQYRLPGYYYARGGDFHYDLYKKQDTLSR